MESFEIYVTLKNGKTKDGRDFTAFETCDTKDKKRLSVAFLRDGKEPLKQSARIIVKSARMDLSRRFPVLRIADYEIVERKEKDNNHIHDFF